MNKNIINLIVFSIFIFVIIITSLTQAMAKSNVQNDYRIFKITFTGTGTYNWEHIPPEPCDTCKNKHSRKMNITFSWKVVYPMVYFSESNIAEQKKNNKEAVPLCMADYPSDIVCSFYYEEGFCETDGAGNPVYVNHKVTNGKGTDNGLAVYVYTEKSKTAGYYDFHIGSVNGFILKGPFQPADECSCPLKGGEYDNALEAFLYSPSETLTADFTLSLKELKSGKKIKKNVACKIPHPPTGYDPDPSLAVNDMAWTGTVTIEPFNITKPKGNQK